VKRLASEFLPVADEVGRLQRGKDAECLFFQAVAEQGHYAGRTDPTNTRQGIYTFAPSGVFLGSINTRSARAVASMLEKALANWKSLPREERRARADPAGTAATIPRYERRFPEDGLALRVVTRDLPRKKVSENPRRNDWRADAWNQDTAWFRPDEARSFLPRELKPGIRHAVPRALVARIAQCHFVDNVRGQTPPFDAADVVTADLVAVVERVAGKKASVRFEGATRAVKKGAWPIDGFNDRNAPTEQERGFETTIEGRGEFDVASERFVELELVASGTRWGATQYNGRADDVEPAPIGVVMALDETASRVAPASLWVYGWR